MITYVRGNLFTSPARVLVNTVNTKGVMGKGIAKTFRDIYPEMYEAYRAACERTELQVGSLHLYRTPHKWVLNFPTKTDWRKPSKAEYVATGLKTFVETYALQGIDSIAFPQLGCGNGGLDWDSQVRPLMEASLEPLPINVFVHLYDGGDHLPTGWTGDRLKEWLRSTPKNLSADAVWTPLASTVDADAGGVTIEGWQITVESNPNAQALVFERGETRVSLDQEWLARWWSVFGQDGFVQAATLPDDLIEVGDPLFQMLRRLPAAVATETRRVRTGEAWQPSLYLLPQPARPAVIGGPVEQAASGRQVQQLSLVAVDQHDAA